MGFGRTRDCEKREDSAASPAPTAPPSALSFGIASACRDIHQLKSGQHILFSELLRRRYIPYLNIRHPKKRSSGAGRLDMTPAPQIQRQAHLRDIPSFSAYCATEVCDPRGKPVLSSPLYKVKVCFWAHAASPRHSVMGAYGNSQDRSGEAGQRCSRSVYNSLDGAPQQMGALIWSTGLDAHVWRRYRHLLVAENVNATTSSSQDGGHHRSSHLDDDDHTRLPVSQSLLV
ncbi:hypothetical protein BASA62_001758 [Batrachochytrium salamandrivorans]|nr:hypothetical protein BASA62_001758 [Batrachochytrium salamandrivorans]